MTGLRQFLFPTFYCIVFFYGQSLFKGTSMVDSLHTHLTVHAIIDRMKSYVKRCVFNISGRSFHCYPFVSVNSCDVKFSGQNSLMLCDFSVTWLAVFFFVLFCFVILTSWERKRGTGEVIGEPKLKFMSHNIEWTMIWDVFLNFGVFIDVNAKYFWCWNDSIMNICLFL